MLNTMKLALVLALLMLSLGQTLSNLQPVADQSEYTKNIISPPLKRGLGVKDCGEWNEEARSLKTKSEMLYDIVHHPAFEALEVKDPLNQIERITKCMRILLDRVPRELSGNQ